MERQVERGSSLIPCIIFAFSAGLSIHEGRVEFVFSACVQLFVGFFSRAYVMYQYRFFLPKHFVNQSLGSYSDPIVVVVAFEFADIRFLEGNRIILQD